MRSFVSGVQIPTPARLNVDGELTLDAAAGTSGHMLVSQGAGNTPAWSNTLTSPTITTSLLTGSTTFNLLTTTATTINFGSAATTMNIATNNVAKTINLGTGGSGGNQVDVNIGTSASATTSNVNLNGYVYIGKPVSGTGAQSGFNTFVQGMGTTATGTTGNATGGNVSIYSGGASISNAGNTAGIATSGNVTIDASSASHAYFDGVTATGTVSIANLTASALNLGRAGITTTVNGTLSSADAKLNNPLLTSISTVGGGGLEGGQINFARVTDGTAYWNIDSYGSTSTPDLRIIENATERFKIAAGGLVTAGGEKVRSSSMVFSLANSSTSTNTTQSVFASANDVLSGLAAATLYRFKAKYYSSFTFNGVNGNVQLLFTFNNAPTAIKYSYRTYSQTAASTTNTSMGVYSVTTASAVVPTQSGSGSWVTEIDGYFTTHATLSSTLTPQFSCSATSASTAVMQAGSYIEIEKLGTSSQTLIAGSWA